MNMLCAQRPVKEDFDGNTQQVTNTEMNVSILLMRKPHKINDDEHTIYTNGNRSPFFTKLVFGYVAFKMYGGGA